MRQIDQRMAEVVVVGQRGGRERRLEIGDAAAFAQGAEEQRGRTGFVLRLDRGEEGRPIPARQGLRGANG